MKRILFFSLFLFLLLSSPALGFEDSVERYPTGAYTDYWDVAYSTSGSIRYGSYEVSAIADPSGISTSTLKLYGSSVARASYGHQYISISSKDAHISPDYITFRLISVATGAGSGSQGLYYYLYKTGTSDLIASFYISSPAANTKYEIIKSSSYYNLYGNGALISSVANQAPSYTGDLDLKITLAIVAHNPYVSDWTITGYAYLDDFSDSSLMGIPEVVTDSTSNLSFTYGAQLMRNNPSSIYNINLYSITNSNNAGKLYTWNITGAANDWGYISTSNTLMSNNYGLYLLEMTKNDIPIYETYFYYDDLSNPVGFPESLFMGSADVSAYIRDYANNGGLISPEGSVYLYATNGTAGYYPISFDIQNTPYNFEATITKVYSSETNISSNITFSGLTNFYNVELDGSDIGTADSDTFSYNIEDWDNYTEHIFEFSPDLTQPGVYGYIKDLNSKTGVHSAIVTVSNNSWSTNIATDETGFYYLPGLLENETYSISAAKSGYTASSTFSVSILSGETTRKDIYLDPVSSGSGYYYASHDVIFTVLEYWYSSAGLSGVSYAVFDNENESVKNGTTGSKGTFTVTDMDAGTNYTFILTYNGTTYTEYLEPGLTEYTLVLNKEGIVHQYYNSWLNLTYAETSNNATILYTSNKTVSAASLSVTASNGTIVQSGTLNSTSGTFLFNFTDGDYILQFNIEASDGSTASQAWSVSSPPEVTLFPASYPTWLKNTLFVAIIIIFLLAFGKSKNDIACGSVAVLTSLGYYFEWLTCSFNFVVLIWIIAIGAIYLHYKRTGAVG